MNKDFYNSVKNELFNNILSYWDKFSRDLENPGFYGEIDNDNIQNKEIDRSIVMTSRFLWTYSAVARLTKNSNFLQMADFAYDVICKKYWDKRKIGKRYCSRGSFSVCLFFCFNFFVNLW